MVSKDTGNGPRRKLRVLSLEGVGGAPSSNPGLRRLRPRVRLACAGRPVVLLRETAGGSIPLGGAVTRSRASAETLIVVFERLRVLTGGASISGPSGAKTW